MRYSEDAYSKAAIESMQDGGRPVGGIRGISLGTLGDMQKPRPETRLADLTRRIGTQVMRARDVEISLLQLLDRVRGPDQAPKTTGGSGIAPVPSGDLPAGHYAINELDAIFDQIQGLFAELEQHV